MSVTNSPSAENQAKTTGVREVKVAADRSGQRLDNFLLNALGGVPRSLIYRLIRTGQVRVNGGRVKPMRKLKIGDRVRLPPVKQPEAGDKRLPKSMIEKIRAAVVHRQQELIVLDKPSGLASQAGSGLNWGLNDLMIEIDPEALPVHRLDRQTSGLMVFARGRIAARALQQAFSGHDRENQAEKRYFALLCRHLKEDRVDVDLPLKKIRDGSGQHRVVVARPEDRDGQTARSSFRLLQRFPEHDFVEVRIETGRTHQIRVHAAALGCPIFGDDKYGHNKYDDNKHGDDQYSSVKKDAAVQRLFLHAGMLRLPWPEDQVFHAPLPTELNDVLDCLRGTRR